MEPYLASLEFSSKKGAYCKYTAIIVQLSSVSEKNKRNQ